MVLMKYVKFRLPDGFVPGGGRWGLKYENFRKIWDTGNLV